MAFLKNACSLLERLKPFLLMSTVQVIFTGLNILSKLAAQDGMKVNVTVAYRFLFSAVFMSPLAFFLERKIRPSLTWNVIIQAFLGGLFSASLGQNLYLESLVLTSASCAAAMFNLIPGVTFVVAVCLRLEILGWKTKAGKAKVIGTIISISGAMIFAFYKGPNINPWRTSINLLHSDNLNATHKSGDKLFVLGIILALLSCVSHSFWFILQAKAVESYPCPYSFTALVCLMASVQSFLFAMRFNGDWSDWKLGWNIRLLTVAYAGILGSGLMFVFMAISSSMRGPLFVTSFNPLLLILVAIGGSITLNEKLHLGNFIGGLCIIVGLYAVLWGKCKEVKGEPKIHQEPEEVMTAADDHQEKMKQLTAVGNGQKVEQTENTIPSVEENALYVIV